MKKYQDIRTALFDLGYTFSNVKSIEGGKVGTVIYSMNNNKELIFHRKKYSDKWKLINEEDLIKTNYFSKNQWLEKLYKDLKQNKYNLNKVGLYSGVIFLWKMILQLIGSGNLVN